MMAGRPLYELTWGTLRGPGPNKEFPKFKGADVKIIVSGSRQYELHSSVLKNASPRMEQYLLPDENAAKLNSKTIKKGVITKYRLDLIRNPDYTDGGKVVEYVLEPVLLDEEGKAWASNAVGLDLENGRAVNPTFLAYDAVFGAFYQVPIDLGDFSTDALTDILITAFDILKVAEYLGCTDVITSPIEATLLATGQVLFVSISNQPAGWLDFAFRIRSRVLFREAMIHAVGQYNSDDMQNMIHTLHPAVAELLTKKANTLKGAVKRSFQLMLSYYPTHLQRERTVGRCDRDNIGRSSYGNDIMDWLALVVLRHFLAQQVADDQTHQAADLGKSVIDVVIAGNDAYLSRRDLETWHGFFPMSGRAKVVLDRKVGELKQAIKQYATVFTKNESQLNVVATPVEHLTCSTLQITEYPWEDFTDAEGSDGVSETEVDDDMYE
ncbi:hypothetical protein B0A55_04369 [Friedmanniomyces simplex]|uniref:BTB domain-containing protein n=1 Tax=Friedmanniomyces simplex TaxID=329884 RepID=A0A4U0XVB2_9PEZI|nr:hypothetical protein B0A55_04369 [Friedmanniomyces simplex]